MDLQDLWRCDSYLLECCWYLNSLTNTHEEAIVDVWRKEKKVFHCSIYKGLAGTRNITTYFEVVATPSKYGQTKSACYSLAEWNRILNGASTIKWFDQESRCFNFPVPQPDLLSYIPPPPNPRTWKAKQFTAESYTLLNSIVKDKELGHICVKVNDQATLRLSIHKEWCTRPLHD